MSAVILFRSNGMSKPPEERLHWVDGLRLLAVTVVVAHHAGQAYGPTGGAWPVFESERSLLLGPFFTVNAGFGMGLFFLLAGYFVPGALSRKGTFKFIADRLVRLGVPLVVVGLGIFALIGWFDYEGDQGFFAFYFDTYIGEWLVQFAHLWFVFHLLIYSLVYAALAQIFPNWIVPGTGTTLGHGKLLYLVLILGILSGLVRTVFPQDTWVDVLGVIPTEPAHLPQYIAMFIFGTLAGRHRWFESMSRPLGECWFRVGLGMALVWYALRYLEDFGDLLLIEEYWLGLLFPIWEALLCVGLCIGLIVYAREHWSRFPPWLAMLARATYGVYLLHVFVVVGFNLALLDQPWDPFTKFVLVTVGTLLVSFSVVLAARRIPWLSKVL